MNYWPAEVTNLAECHEPLFDLIEELREPGRRTARAHYGARGFVAHHNTDLWRRRPPVDGARSGLWPMGAAWLSHAPLGALRLRRRPGVPARQAYPVMKEASEFLLDFLVEDEQGRLVTNPRISPENAFLDDEGQRGRALRGRDDGLRDHPRALRRLHPRRARSSARTRSSANASSGALDRLPPYQIGKHGQLQEWLKDFDEPEPGHRHISHLFALHPGHSITLRGTPELAKAARVSLERRLANGGGGTGWSRAWIVNLWARLGDGDKALENLTDAAREVDAAEPVRQPPAVPDRRQLRRHRRHRRDAAAEPRGRARPAAGPARRPGRTAASPACARAAPSRSTSPGSAACSSARWCAPGEASPARYDTASGPSSSRHGREG